MIYSAKLSILISKAFALIPCCLFWTQLMGHLFGSWAPCRPSWRAGWWSGGQCWEGPIPMEAIVTQTHLAPHHLPLKPSLADLDKERPKGGWAYHHEQLSCGGDFSKLDLDQNISSASVWKIPTVVDGKHVRTLLIKVVCCLAAPSGAFLSGSFMNPCSLVAFYSVTHGGQT